MTSPTQPDETLQEKLCYLIGYGDTNMHGTLQTCNITNTTIDEIMELIATEVQAARIDELKRLRSNHDQDSNYYTEIIQRQLQLSPQDGEDGKKQ